MKPLLLITGAAGGLARITVNQLAADYELVGVDLRDLPQGTKFPGEFRKMSYTQRYLADLFREKNFHGLIHLGRIPLNAEMSPDHRYTVNVQGTRNILDLAQKYSLKKVIVLSSFHVYGAHPHNPMNLTEDDSLRATQNFPELADAVELDHLSVAFMLAHPEIQTVVLRPANVIGTRIRNQISNLLRSERVPILMGYDPMMQFIHESDLSQAILLVLESEKSGVYNVAGEGLVPYSYAIRLAGGKEVQLPHFFVAPMMGLLFRAGIGFPSHLANYYRYPTIISDARIRRELGYEPRVTTVAALRGIRKR